ncbi:MAG: plasmid recombination protein [bacterium]
MYDGKQVVRVETKYKQSDLFNIGKEMSDRKGTGNYDKERLEYNYTYVTHNERNLYQGVKQKLKEENIEYLNKKNTNVLNGITFTSGNEFFGNLGMKFKETDRFYQTGDKKGVVVKVPDINNESDIPEAVSNYFNYCMEFLENYVGKDNIILSEVHYDEDTPHLQAYFIPIVNEVSRKQFLKDNEGNLIKEETKNKNGDIKLLPIVLRDEQGKIIYEQVKGKFLNNDQFWKDRGGKNSFAKMQDEFNKFITDKGYNLDRGNIGANVHHQTKLEYQIKEQKAKLEELITEKNNVKKIFDNSKEVVNKKLDLLDKDNLLEPRAYFKQYHKKDVDKILDYTKNLEKQNILSKAELNEKELIINSQNKKIELYKSNTLIKEKDNLIAEKNETIKKQSSIINKLNDNLEELKYKLEFLKNMYFNLGKALASVLKIKKKDSIEEYDKLSRSINAKSKNYDMEL